MPGSKKVADKPRLQYGALPFRLTADGALEIMLVTSRETRRWVIPKGWPIKGLKPHASAAREAFEEAGVVGEVGKAPIGSFTYDKRRKNGTSVQCEVTVFPLRVTQQRKRWPEKDQRDGRWFSRQDAAEAVAEAGLSDTIRAFDPEGHRSEEASDGPAPGPDAGPGRTGAVQADAVGGQTEKSGPDTGATP